MRPASLPLDAGRFEIRADLRPPGAARPSLAPHRPTVGAARPRLLRTAAASTLLIGILVALAREEAATGTGPPLSPPPPVGLPLPVWTAAGPLYILDGQPLSARTHPALGREDTFALGAFGEDAPHLRLVLPRGPTPRPSLFVDVARSAAAEGIGVVRIGRAFPVQTAFGPAEVADAVLSAHGAPAIGASGPAEASSPAGAPGGRTCLVFRFGGDGLVGAGWLCGATERPGRPAKPATGEHLACLLDRLDLHPGATAAAAMRQLFATAGTRRLARCGPPRAVAEPAPERIPAELFSAAALSGEGRAEATKLDRSRRRERP